MTITKANVKNRADDISLESRSGKYPLPEAICRLFIGVGDGGNALYGPRHLWRAELVLRAIEREKERKAS